MTNIVKLKSLPYDHLKLSSDEIARLSPVQDAVLADNTEELRRLIQTLSPPVCYLQNQFDTAIRQVKLAAARCLVEEGAEIDGNIMFTACFSAKSIDVTESIRLFELLLELGWNVNAFWSSMPALEWVIENDKLVEWFLSHGADPNIGRQELWNSESDFISESGQVLNDAAERGSLRTFELLLQHGARPENSLALHYAAAAEFSEDKKTLMERLLLMGFDINQLDDALGYRREGTPLYCAAARGRLQTVRFLLEHGADPSIENHNGGIAVNVAARKRHQSTVNLLREWSAQDLESQ